MRLKGLHWQLKSDIDITFLENKEKNAKRYMQCVNFYFKELF